MTISTHYDFSRYEAASAAAELLDEPLHDQDILDSDLLHPTSSTFRAARLTGILPTLLTVASVGLSSTPTLAEPLLQQWRLVSGRYVAATSSNRHAGLGPVVSAYEATQFGVPDRVVAELEKLSDGWAGEGSLAPTPATIQDVDLVLSALPASSIMPDIEVDDDDGVVTLRWMTTQQTKSCALVFRGDGRVTGVFSTIDPPRSTAWSANVRDDTKIAIALDELSVREVITG